VTALIKTLDDISHNYDALFVDLWGCVHNGIEAYPGANESLKRYRANGGKVVLVTNSPRPRSGVEKQLIKFGVDSGAWDLIATSGDSARMAMFQGLVGNKVYFIGTPFEENFFEPLRVVKNPVTIERVPIDEAEGIVCTGPFNSLEDLDVYLPDFKFAKKKGLKLLCANPDIIVDRGNVREWCAGALAKMYTDLGGESLYFGKPFQPIYDLARRRLSYSGAQINDDRILAIGDGITTDILGAKNEGLDSLFITGGLAALETGTEEQPDQVLLEYYLKEQKLNPAYSIGFLR
jgi:HAD superfamily hydrolase (TIGR01459 family)